MIYSAPRLVTMLSGGAATSYIYNGAGNLALETLSGVQTGYVCDGENRLTKITNSDGSLSTYT